MADEKKRRARKGRSAKRGLPFPYNQDLSGVLRHLNRRTRAFRARLANDPVTAAYLAAGMRLLARHFGPGADRGPRRERPSLSFLSQRAVAGEVARNPGEFPRRGSVAALRDRWPAQSEFVADLINFATWRENRPESRKQHAANIERLAHGPDFVRAVHETAYQHTVDGLATPTVRLGLSLMTAAEGDEEVTQAVARMTADYLAQWKDLYARVMRERGLRLRPGLTLDDLANALSAISDGLVLRTISDPAAGVIDHDSRRTLVGTTALAVIYAFVEPDDTPTGQTLEQAVATKFET